MTRFDTRMVGAGLVAAGALLLVLLRFWASPLARAVTGGDSVGVVSFLAIPIFLVFVALGIALLLWGPEITATE